jgi:hypothetical protein
MEEMWNIKMVLEIQANTASMSLTSGPTQSPGSPYFKIDVHDASDLQFGCPANAWTAKEMSSPIPLVPWSTKIGIGHNRRNKTDFLKLSSAAPPILSRWPIYQVGVR